MFHRHLNMYYVGKTGDDLSNMGSSMYAKTEKDKIYSSDLNFISISISPILSYSRAPMITMEM